MSTSTNLAIPPEPTHHLHLHDGPIDDLAHAEESGSIPARSPTIRLYRHALESIFAFLSLRDLNAVLTVDHSWLDAVKSMRSIRAVVYRLPPGLCASILTRHIGEIGTSGGEVARLTGSQLIGIDRCMSGLHTIHCRLDSPIDQSLVFPSSLTYLDVELPSHSLLAEEVNLVILLASCIPNLTSFQLQCFKLDPLVSLAPLCHASHLSKLTLSVGSGWMMTFQQVDELRSMSQLIWLDFPLISSSLESLLRLPHDLQWQRLCISGHVDKTIVRSLSSLSSLTHLQVERAQDATFLCALPNLRTLSLIDFGIQKSLLSPERIIEGFPLCRHLIEFTMFNSNLTSAHMHHLLSCMPKLELLNLTRMPQLDSLSFLSDFTPFKSELTNIYLKKCRHLQLRAVKDSSYLLIAQTHSPPFGSQLFLRARRFVQ